MIARVIFALLLVQAITSAPDDDDNTHYEVGPLHGDKAGVESTIICPFGGALTGLNYKVGKRIDQIEFVCTSALGQTTYGPYGDYTNGKSGSLHCPSGEYISSFNGKSYWLVDRLGFRCRPRNDMNSHGKVAGSFGFDGGADFDEVALSIGARPISIKLRLYEQFHSMQVTYANTTITGELCTTCKTYKEQWAGEHGGNGGTLRIITCPQDGVITGIKYSSSNVLNSVTFICSSLAGVTEFGPYGTSTNGRSGEENCPPGAYISSIHGGSGYYLDSLGIRCRRVGQVREDPKRTAHGGHRGNPFDDLAYSSNSQRPVQIRIRTGIAVDQIQVKYANMPISINCKVASIVVTDKTIVAEDAGYEVIGLSSGSTCNQETQTLILYKANSVTQTTGVTTEEGGGKSWSTSVSLEFTFGVEGVGAKADTSVGLTQSYEGSKSWSRSEEVSTSKESTTTLDANVNYKGPGACVAIGVMKRYKLERDRLPVLYHFKCEGGATTPQQGSIKLESTMFGQASFWDYTHEFKTRAECSREARQCVTTIRANKILSAPWDIEKDFEKCFK